MPATPAAPARLLIVSHDIVGAQMAGPGIRYTHLARALAAHVPTTLAVPGDGSAPPAPANSPPAHSPPANSLPANSLPANPAPAYGVVGYRRRMWETLAPAVAQADVVFCPSDVVDELPQLADSAACLAIDGYDPLLAEWLALSRGPGPSPGPSTGPSPGPSTGPSTGPGASTGADAERRRAWERRLTALARQYVVGDFYVCASERQRDWWLGLLEASGRINPATFDADPSLRSLIDVVPYGLPDGPLPPPRPVLKGRWPGIEAGDRLALWGGGLWPWLDPLTAIRAVGLVRQEVPTLKLVFPGTRHPNAAMAGMPNQTAAAKALAADLGLLETGVFFGDWVPYADWAHVLQECDVALSLHFDTVETRLAFRSRVLETIWAGLPTVATRGDATSDLLAAHGLGVIVPEGDVGAVARALRALLAEAPGARAASFAAAREALTWERAAAPLVRFCRAPQRAPDRLGPSADYDPLAALRRERDEWRSLAEGYARGRVMRALNWLGNWGRG